MDVDETPSQTGPTDRTGWFALFRESLRGTDHDFSRGDLRRAIPLLAIPMVLEMSMEAIFAVVDVFWVGRLGADAVATVGLTESVMTLVYAMAFGLAMSTTALVSRRVGEDKREEAGIAGAQAIWIGLMVGVAFGVPGAIFAPELLRLMGGSASVVESGSGFTRVLLAGNAVVMLIFLNNAIFRGGGDATTAMRALWIANGINLILDPCLIFGVGPFPELGVTGAAVATTTGRGIGVLYQFSQMSKPGARVHIGRDNLGLRTDVMRRLISVSWGGIAQQLVATASWIALVRMVATFGSDAVAGYTIAIRIVIFAILPAWGLANAAATLVGQSLGAGDPDRAERAVWLTGVYNMVFMGTLALVFVLLPGPVVSLFTDEAAVAAVAADSLRIIAYGYVFYAWEMVFVQAFNGAGDTATPTRINILCFWLIQIPLGAVLAFPLGLGPRGIFIAVASCYSLAAVVGWLFFRGGRWKTTQV